MFILLEGICKLLGRRDILELFIICISFLDRSIINLSRLRISSNDSVRSLFLEENIKKKEKLHSLPILLIDLLLF